MRNFHPLDTAETDPESGILTFITELDAPFKPQLALRKEGAYVSLSVSHGPIEIALRPRLDDLRRVLARLYPVEGLQTTRQAGSGEAYISLGLQTDGSLLMRPTLVADASGHLCFNLTLSDAMRRELFDWLGVVTEPEQTLD